MNTVGSERGAAAVEVVLLVPALVLVLCVLTAGWRLHTARTAVSDAAAAAARAATVESSAGAARQRALEVAAEDLRLTGFTCGGQDVEVDASGFNTSPGTAASVRVTARCTVSLSDLLVPGLPGHWQVDATRQHPMDTFRERRP